MDAQIFCDGQAPRKGRRFLQHAAWYGSGGLLTDGHRAKIKRNGFTCRWRCGQGGAMRARSASVRAFLATATGCKNHEAPVADCSLAFDGRRRWHGWGWRLVLKARLPSR